MFIIEETGRGVALQQGDWAAYGNSLYFLLNFSITPKRFLETKPINQKKKQILLYINLKIKIVKRDIKKIIIQLSKNRSGNKAHERRHKANTDSRNRHFAVFYIPVSVS